MEEGSSGTKKKLKRGEREREKEKGETKKGEKKEEKRKRKGESTSPPRFSSLSRTLPSKELRLNA